jgi:hypothetical protein
MLTKMCDTRSSGYSLMNIAEDGVHGVISLYRLVDSWVRRSLILFIFLVLIIVEREIGSHLFLIDFGG